MDRQRFEKYVERVDSGCWEWRGYRAYTGYGKCGSVATSYRKDLAHRVAYELYVGPIPDGLTIDHLCRNRGCVNPDHLQPVTLAENIRRAHPERLTCRRGHDLADSYVEVTRHGREYRRCGVCHRERQRVGRANRAAARAGVAGD